MERLIRLRDVTERLGGISRSSLYRRLEIDANFPRPVHLPGSRLAMWRESDLDAYLKSLAPIESEETELLRRLQ